LRLKLIACEILYRELCAVAARSINQVDVQFLPKGLHDIGQPAMNARLREALAAVDVGCDAGYDAVLLGYGLCSNGVVGLAASRVPLVIPRAHDCIALFLGSKERYQAYFESHPGVYFETTGWIERGEQTRQQDPRSILSTSGLALSYDELVAKYGEDNARYLHDQLGDATRNYRSLAFIEMGIEPDDRFERIAREKAAREGWTFEKLPGDLSLLRALVDGPWDADRFLIVPPGHRVAASFDGRIVKMEKGQVQEAGSGVPVDQERLERSVDCVVRERYDALRRLAQ
jgi:hypothetical protein